MNVCDGHASLKECHDKLRIEHDNLVDRIRTNETKYMPAVDAAYRALEKADALKLELNMHVANFNNFDDRQELIMENIIKRLDSQDEVRKAHLELAMETAKSLENHMQVEEKVLKLTIRVFKFLIVPIVVTLISYMGWLGLQIIDIQKDIAVYHKKG